MDNLPAFRKAVAIEFWGLRNQLGSNYGVIHDVDTRVVRTCYRVKTKDGWQWLIKGLRRMPAYDIYAESDQICLDDIGDCMEDIKILDTA